MATVGVSEAQARLPELVDAAQAGDEVVITRNGAPVAKLVSVSPTTSLRNLRPSSVAAVLRPLSADDDSLDDMCGS